MERSNSEEGEPENKYKYTMTKFFSVRFYYFVYTNFLCVFLSMFLSIFLRMKGEFT